MLIPIWFLLILNLLLTSYLVYLIFKKYQKPIANQKETISIPSAVTKLNLIRFNPFDDLGSDQSFILALLDQTNSGVIITSLHHRNFTRIYAKPIKNGEGDGITLSKEEKSAIFKTINR
jgi:hypothetical protein